jgi:D-alanyl-D-alanine carboxypeptidase (penicillin-binding protein 5/6)
MQGALAVAGYGLLGATPGGGIRPIASVAKVMTAYRVLLDHPLGRRPGPLITVTAADVALLRQDIATGQSTVRVVAGERISEAQALLALLLPSANNIATLLARWDAGSVPAFVARMNATARALGLTHTRYADASGFDPRTESTASDQVRLATTALGNATFAKLVSTPATRLPYAGLVRNVNALLGHDGVVGVKTGTTGWAGACLVFAAVRRVGGRRVLLVGALLGGPQAQFLGPVFQATARLLAAAGRALDVRTAIPAGAVVAQLRRGGTQLATVAAARPVQVIAWPGLTVSVSVASGAAGAPGGPLSVTATVGYQQVPVTTTVKPATGWTPRR